MTEDEARTKWCPMVRVLVTRNDNVWQGNMLTNRGEIPASNTDTLCIASDCMMWQATDNEFDPEPPQTSAVRVPQKGKPAGYCGLAR